MSENSKLTNIKSLANLQVSDIDFFKKLSEQNKLKVWSNSPIKIGFTDGKLIHNADEIAVEINNLSEFINKNIEQSDSVEDIIVMEAQTSILYKWLIGTRQQATKPLDELKTSFTASEKKLKNIDFSSKINELNKAIYTKRRKAIYDVFQSYLILNSDLEIDMRLFNDFIETKMKLKIFNLNKSGELSASATKQIDEQFSLVANPLIEIKEKSERADKERLRLSKYIQDLQDFELDVQLKKLNEKILDVKEDYELISIEAEQRFKTEIALINTNIRNRELENKEKVSESADKEIAELISSYSYVNRSLEEVEKDLCLIKNDRDRLVSVGYIASVNYKVKDIEQHINNERAIQAEKIRIEREQQQTLDIDKSLEDKMDEVLDEYYTYKLNKDDVEFIGLAEVEASSEDEAKGKMLEQFKIHLDFIELTKK